MGTWTRRATLVMGLMAAVAPLTAQEDPQDRQAYFRAVADFFEVSRDEIAILGEWDLPAGEIPVALFVAERAGVSPEALVALRRSGSSWSRLAARYHLDASHFHVPLAQGADPGVLAGAYEGYRSRPAGDWSQVALDDAEIVALVNLRIVSQTLRVPASEVLARASPGDSWVAVYRSFLRRPSSGATDR